MLAIYHGTSRVKALNSAVRLARSASADRVKAAPRRSLSSLIPARRAVLPSLKSQDGFAPRDLSLDKLHHDAVLSVPPGEDNRNVPGKTITCSRSYNLISALLDVVGPISQRYDFGRRDQSFVGHLPQVCLVYAGQRYMRLQHLIFWLTGRHLVAFLRLLRGRLESA